MRYRQESAMGYARQRFLGELRTARLWRAEGNRPAAAWHLHRAGIQRRAHAIERSLPLDPQLVRIRAATQAYRDRIVTRPW